MPGFPLAQVVTTKDMVNVRAMPSTTAAVVTLLAANTEVDLTDTGVMSPDGGPQWLRVSYNGQTGYVRSDLVSAPHAKGKGPVTSATSTVIPAITPATPPTPDAFGVIQCMQNTDCFWRTYQQCAAGAAARVDVLFAINRWQRQRGAALAYSL